MRHSASALAHSAHKARSRRAPTRVPLLMSSNSPLPACFVYAASAVDAADGSVHAVAAAGLPADTALTLFHSILRSLAPGSTFLYICDATEQVCEIPLSRVCCADFVGSPVEFDSILCCFLVSAFSLFVYPCKHDRFVRILPRCMHL